MSTRTFAGGVLIEKWDDETRRYWSADEGERPYTEDEAAPLVAAEQTVAREATRVTIEDTARVALEANGVDLSEDEAVRAQAAAIADSPVTNLTTTQIVGVLKDLARGLVILAGNDVNTKRELNALIRLVVGELDSTDGTT